MTYHQWSSRNSLFVEKRAVPGTVVVEKQATVLLAQAGMIARDSVVRRRALWSLLRRVRNDHPSTDLASSGRGASDLLVAENPGRDVYRTTVGSFSLGDGVGGCAARVPGWTVSLAGGLTMMKVHKVEPVLICA